MGDMVEEESKEVRVTYETLYEFLRNEKNREEIQQLDPNFYTDVLEYLQEKQKHYEQSLNKEDLFSLAERDKVSQQLSNAKKILKELYQRREKKIMELAMNKSRTGSNLINTANLLKEEGEFFNELVVLFDKWRDDVLVKIMSLQMPHAAPTVEARSEPPRSTIIEKPPMQAELDQGPEPEPEPQQPSPEPQPEEPKETPQEADGPLFVRFLSSVDQFMGEELETYGPFQEDDKAYIPRTLAQILIDAGKAKVEEEE